MLPAWSRPRLATLRHTLAAAADRWPNRCAVCHTDTQGPRGRVCGACLARFAAPRPRCLRCALEVPGAAPVCGACLRAPPPWSRTVAACDYGHPWDGLLTALKFHDALDLVPALAARLAEQVEAGGAAPVDAVLAVPLADARLRERGYNQAALLADAVARRLGLPRAPQALRRVVDTPHQTALPREQRAANMRGAFAVDGRALPSLAGRCVAVVDDVMTTGATLGEIARVLQAAGVAEVQAWVVARTPR